jgi:hypothetical protein
MGSRSLEALIEGGGRARFPFGLREDGKVYNIMILPQ